VGVNNPGLAPLADNGGPTQTHKLLSTSPALDKGNSFGLTTDQRGPAIRERSMFPPSQTPQAVMAQTSARSRRLLTRLLPQQERTARSVHPAKSRWSMVAASRSRSRPTHRLRLPTC